MTSRNIFLIVLDAVRKDHLSTYGYDRPTSPNLSELASTATKYTQAISAGPWTPVSHGAMFSGQWPSNSGIYGRQPNFGAETPNIAELLGEAGYRTLGFSNSYHTSPDRGFDRGFDYYHDILSLPRIAGTMYESSAVFARHLYNYFLKGYDDSSFQMNKLLSELSGSKQPSFAFLNMNSAHSPYNPPETFRDEFESYVQSRDAVDEATAREYSEDAYKYVLDEIEMGEPEWELVRSWYDAEIRYMDTLLGEFFDFLKDHNAFDDSMIFVTSDHGEFFGENGHVYHQFSLSDILLNVPLVVKWPGQTQSRVSESLTSLVDLAPTALGVTDRSVPEQMDGLDLAESPDREAVYAEYAGPSESIRRRMVEAGRQYESYTNGLQAIRTAQHKLVIDSGGERTLYEISDEGEKAITDTDVMTELYKRLTDDLSPLPTEAADETLDQHVKHHLRDMGYM